MSYRIKKISVVIYFNGDFEEMQKTLYSIVDQELSHLFYDVFIINDNQQKNTKMLNKLNSFISKNDLINFKIFSLENYSGLPMSFNFLLKNNIVKNKYVTIMQTGDVLEEGFLSHFVNILYPKNLDLYMFDFKDEFLKPTEKIGENGRKYVISKTKVTLPFVTGVVDNNEAITTHPIFFGKIWKTSRANRIFLSDNKILYQDIFMYYQMILNSRTIWYEKRNAGAARREPMFPNEMDSKRIELLSLTLNSMISRNPYLNGQVLQLLALALERTKKEDRKLYLIPNYKYLQDNYEIFRSYNISKRKILKLTRPFIESGELSQ